MLCSDNLKCLHVEKPEYDACQYRKNLEAGRVFYGKNKGTFNMELTKTETDIKQVIEKPVTLLQSKFQEPTRLYIECYGMMFHVGHLGKQDCTYSLTEDELSNLKCIFEKNVIPHTFILDDMKCIIDGDTIEPANSRVIFQIPGIEQEFVIANYNIWCIRKRYADMIAKALNNKGLKAYVQVSGTYKDRINYDTTKKIADIVKGNVTRVNNGNDITFKMKANEPIVKTRQVSIFEFV
jgi:hypothetical protein